VCSEILLRAQEDCYDKEGIIADFILHGDQLTYCKHRIMNYVLDWAVF